MCAFDMLLFPSRLAAGVLASQQQQQVDVMNHPIDPFATASHK
jgi:hypothetical protein